MLFKSFIKMYRDTVKLFLQDSLGAFVKDSSKIPFWQIWLKTEERITKEIIIKVYIIYGHL